MRTVNQILQRVRSIGMFGFLKKKRSVDLDFVKVNNLETIKKM